MYCCYSRWFGARDECVGDVGDGLGLFGGWWLGLHKHQMWTVTGKKGEATNSVPMLLLLLMMMLMMLVMFWDSLPCELCLRAGAKSTAAGPQDNEDPVFSSPYFSPSYAAHCSIKLQITLLTCFVYFSLQWKLELPTDSHVPCLDSTDYKVQSISGVLIKERWPLGRTRHSNVTVNRDPGVKYDIGYFTYRFVFAVCSVFSQISSSHTCR